MQLQGHASLSRSQQYGRVADKHYAANATAKRSQQLVKEVQEYIGAALAGCTPKQLSTDT